MKMQSRSRGESHVKKMVDPAGQRMRKMPQPGMMPAGMRGHMMGMGRKMGRGK